MLKDKMEESNIIILTERDIYEGLDVYTIIKHKDYFGNVVFTTKITDDAKIRGMNIERIMDMYFNDELIAFNSDLIEQLRQYIISRLEQDYQAERSDILDLHILENGIDTYINLRKFRFDVPIYETDFEKIYLMIVRGLDIPMGAYVYDSVKLPFMESIASLDHAVITMFIQGEWCNRASQ